MKALALSLSQALPLTYLGQMRSFLGKNRKVLLTPACAGSTLSACSEVTRPFYLICSKGK
jgi:hypothetical protein